MKLPNVVSRFVMRFPRALALIAAAPVIPIGSEILPFWHECESILAVTFLFCVLVVVDVKVQGNPWAEFH